ncbi:hypothetical protein [Chryseobacterium sp. RU33C]|uniref:hypothetical protein n=1 Tax=Chryseobacterium sp. RU33C TaxID=1907398 RepID=UPI000955AB53|nr:hypothetical protein [Chryseobacterium sp. RU33C]SIP91916.1 hypothetical protein SAMN05880573_101132 [Chryseobacterium sp. RU33C]
MKRQTLIMWMLLFMSTCMFSQKIQIRLDNDRSFSFDNTVFDKSIYKKNLEEAFIIANAVFNSVEFQSLYTEKKFPGWNRCKPEKCKPSKKDSTKIAGTAIYSRLYQKDKVDWIVYFKEKHNSALGSTCPDTGVTTAYYKNIIDDMPELPLSYAIAVNLCHEYMHQIGFCHLFNKFDEDDKETPDRKGYKNDISYRVGWDAYYILKEWLKMGKKINGL